ncbi:MAG: class I SAM-dependent methyltransferase [Burkholderiales bacterium]
MRPEEYDAWYATQRGAWIGTREYRLLVRLLEPRPGDTLLDVGCGTGYFTRRFEAGGFRTRVTGADLDLGALRYASQHSARRAETYVCADARTLPFPDRSVDLVISVTALCFINEERAALAEMLRVARRRVALGLLNRHSLLYLEKGRGEGKGAYRGARWHTPRQALALFTGLPVSSTRLATAVFLPRAGLLARRVEPCLQNVGAEWGSFIAVTADHPQ